MRGLRSRLLVLMTPTLRGSLRARRIVVKENFYCQTTMFTTGNVQSLVQSEDSLRALPRASVILRPGIPMLPAGTERYRVRGGGSVLVPVRAGDRFTVIDVEGGQPGE